MWDMKKNYKKEEEQPLCPSYEKEEDTIENVFRCGRDTDRKQRNNKNNMELWDKVEQIYREKKKKKRINKRESLRRKFYIWLSCAAVNREGFSVGDLCWGDNSVSDQRKEQQEPQVDKSKRIVKKFLIRQSFEVV